MFNQNFHPHSMKKFALTALSTAIYSLTMAVSSVAPTFAQQPVAPVAPAAPATAQPQPIDRLKLTKDQQTKLVKLGQNFMQKKMAVLTPIQKNKLAAAQQQGKAPDLALTTAQQNQLKKLYISALAQQDAILTTEQKQTLQELNKQYAPPQR
jgi:Spy/CpxP family protein refolding chaperone